MKPSPSLEIRLRTGTRTSSNSRFPRGRPGRRSRTPAGCASTVTPGVSNGTRIWLCCVYVGASGCVLPITIMIRQLGWKAFVIHHLRPLSTYSSPSRSMRSAMLVASELATSGSVIANAERISPSSSGVSQRSFCSSCAELVQHLHVAGVGRRAVARLGGDARAPEDLRQRRVVAVGQAGAVLGVGQEHVPQPGLARAALQLLHDRRLVVRVAGLAQLALVDVLGRVDVLVHERASGAP